MEGFLVLIIGLISCMVIIFCFRIGSQEKSKKYNEYKNFYFANYDFIKYIINEYGCKKMIEEVSNDYYNLLYNKMDFKKIIDYIIYLEINVDDMVNNINDDELINAFNEKCKVIKNINKTYNRNSIAYDILYDSNSIEKIKNEYIKNYTDAIAHMLELSMRGIDVSNDFRKAIDRKKVTRKKGENKK